MSQRANAAPALRAPRLTFVFVSKWNQRVCCVFSMNPGFVCDPAGLRSDLHVPRRRYWEVSTFYTAEVHLVQFDGVQRGKESHRTSFGPLHYKRRLSVLYYKYNRDKRLNSGRKGPRWFGTGNDKAVCKYSTGVKVPIKHFSLTSNPVQFTLVMFNPPLCLSIDFFFSFNLLIHEWAQLKVIWLCDRRTSLQPIVLNYFLCGHSESNSEEFILSLLFNC